MATTTERAASPAPGFGLPKLIPSLPMTMLNSINPFASPEAGKTTSETKEIPAQEPFFKRPIFGTLLSRPTPANDDAKAMHNRNDSTTVMFAEPVVTDSDDASREGSVADNRRRRSRVKPKTSFSICHPPPASLARHKLHRRPRSLLQLHRLQANARPVPAYEVIPSANFSAHLTKSIIRTYKTKHTVCYNDLVILRAEKYYTEEHEEEQDAQDILALICRGRPTESSTGKVKICMSNGEEWEAYPHTSGGYEFFTTDDHGLAITVRWVPKRCKDSKQSTTRKFNFSTIAQGTRRHPVIATLSEAGMDINDTYRVPDAAASTPLSTPKNTDSFLAQAMEDEDVGGTDECVTDERLRSIIMVTGIYVAFKEGWSPYFKYDDKDAVKPGMSPRKESITIATPPGSPMQKSLEKRGSIRSVGSGLLRRSSLLSKANRDSTASVESVVSIDSAPKTGRARSDSASTVLVHRAASNRRRNNGQATWRPDLLKAQNSVPETSREDLTRTSRSPRLSTVESVGSPISNSVVASPTSIGVGSPSRAMPTAEEEEEEEEDTDIEESPHETKDDKAGSTATSDAASEPSRVPPDVKRASPVRKSGRWRKIFCIR